MTKSILEAIAEVQRKINERREKNAESTWTPEIKEGWWDDARKKAGDLIGLRSKSNTPTTTNTTSTGAGRGSVVEPSDARAAAISGAPGASPPTTTNTTSAGAGRGSVVEPSGARAAAISGARFAEYPPTVSTTPSVTKPVTPAPKPVSSTSSPTPGPNGAPLPTPAAPVVAPTPQKSQAAQNADAAIARTSGFSEFPTPAAPVVAPTPQKSQAAQNADAAIARTSGFSEFEDGGPTKSKGKKSMKEETSPLVAAFLKLQESNPNNMFEAAKKLKGKCPNCGKVPCVCKPVEEELSPKQKKIAALGGDKKKLDAADFKALRAGKKPMEEETEELDELSKQTLGSYAKKASKDVVNLRSPGINDPYRADKRAKKVDLAINKLSGAGYTKVPANEEAELFSEEELAHFASIIEGDAPSLAPARDDIAGRSDKHDQNSDYGMDEEAKKRGVKAGTKRGPYKQKGTSEAEKDEAQGETKNVPAQIRTARSKRVDDKEVVPLTHPTTNKTYHVPVKHVNDFNVNYASAEKPHEKKAIEHKFVSTHMSS